MLQPIQNMPPPIQNLPPIQNMPPPIQNNIPEMSDLPSDLGLPPNLDIPNYP